MLDRVARRTFVPLFDRMAQPLARRGVDPNRLTGVGFVIGLAACVAAALAAWWWALALWLLNRLVDGIDGPLARRMGVSARGGFLDIMADFAIYGGFVVGVAVGQPDARLACAALLAGYYVSGSAFLALSSLEDPDDTHQNGGDGRSLRFLGGLAEGTETIIVHSLFCLFPGAVAPIAWVFAGMVALTAAYRVWSGVRVLPG
ncbi:MAG: CDP-alcohol phosphatidyltransferase family protein [Nitriliruptorales bacterium]|nr:CDP-alcohol phosphatidyltransferase family protein [Nitriliruptorales bacterium]